MRNLFTYHCNTCAWCTKVFAASCFSQVISEFLSFILLTLRSVKIFPQIELRVSICICVDDVHLIYQDLCSTHLLLSPSSTSSSIVAFHSLRTNPSHSFPGISLLRPLNALHVRTKFVHRLYPLLKRIRIKYNSPTRL